MLLHTVQKIAWIPDNNTPEKDYLKGHYTIVIKRKSGAMETLIPTNEWVHLNFNAKVLASCQRLAYQRKETLVCIEANDTSVTRTGYIHVETEGITCSATDTRVINRLKYVPKRSVSSGPIFTTDENGKKVKAERKQTIIPHHWHGYCNATNENIKLTDAWVTMNFKNGYLKQVMSATGAGTPYLIVPPGESRTQPPNLDSAGPINKYRQKNGDMTCMSLALANALHYLGKKTMGHIVFSKSKHCERKAWSIRQYCESLRSTNKLFSKITYPNTATVDLLGNITTLHLVVILGVDGKEDHCIALTKDWIFDPNFDRALPRSTESLNQCCSSADVATNFLKAVSIAVFPKIMTT